MGRIHSSIYLLILFLSLVSGGLFYYIDINRSEQHYIHTQSKLMNLKFLDRDFDNFFYQYAFFTNFDYINRDIKHFESLLLDLKEDIAQFTGDKERLTVMLHNIDKSFEEREQAIEYFKSQKATLINSVHFLHDLQATIQEDNRLLLVQNHIQESLFASMQYLIAEYIDTVLIKDNLKTIQKYAIKKGDERLKTYVRHNSLLLHNIIELKKLTKEAKSHKIEPTLEALGFELDSLYQESVKIQKFIALMLFIFSIVVLLILIMLQIKFLRSKRELQSYKYAVEHSDNTIVLTDIHKNITYVNDLFEINTGYSKDEVLGKNPRVLSSGEQDDAYYKNMHEQLSKGESWQGEFINKRKDGSLYYERASIVPIFLDNELINYLAIKLDITEYIEQNHELQQAASLFENTEEAILITDVQNRITRVNKAFCTLYGYKEDEVIGKNPNILKSNRYDPQYFVQMWSTINATGAWRGKIYNRTKSGEVTPLWMTIKGIYDRDGNISSYTAIQTDLREIEASQARAKYLAYNDPLCDLPNRISFERHLKEHINKVKTTQKRFALLFIDLDRLKVINDTLGHTMGDELLKAIAQRLASRVGKNDYLARWGGDEFVYLLTDLSSKEEVIFKTTILLDAIKESIVINERHLTTTASIGIACYPKDAQDANRLMKYADSAMYHAKEQGKNTYHFYSKTLSKEIQRKLDIELALRKALENQECYLHFQPQYNLKRHKIDSIEALLRWENTTLGFVSPVEFIPIAEDTGLITSIGYFVFEEACRGFKDIQASGIDIQRVGINVSSVQFRDPRLVENFVVIAQKYDIKPQSIEIEITERYIMEQSDANYQLINELREEGFKISIDDFGTGYSSMSYFSKLPLDAIKIDKSFVDDIGKEGKESEVIRAIIALSKTFGYTLIAEGIEYDYQEQFLVEHGCDLGQGYLFDRPLSKEDLIKKYKNKDEVLI